MKKILPTIASGLSMLLLGFSALMLAGCPGTKLSNPQQAPVQILPNTTFTPATTVPSVTPSLEAPTTQATATAGDMQLVRNKAAGLTVMNLGQEQPNLLNLIDWAAAGVQRIRLLLATTTEKANTNDIAVARLTAEVTGARDLVKVRESQLVENAKTYETNMKQKDEFWQGKVNEIAIDRDKWRKKAEDKDAAMIRWIWGGTLGLGILLLVGGGLVAFLMPVKKTAGIVVSGTGGVCICLAMAGLMFGIYFAIAGLAIGGIAILGALWAVIHYMREEVDKHATAGMQIADGVQQAIHAQAIDLEKAKPFLDQSQGPIAKDLVDAATKTPEELAKDENPYQHLAAAA